MLAQTEDAERRLMRELLILKLLNHQHIAKLYEVIGMHPLVSPSRCLPQLTRRAPLKIQLFSATQKRLTRYAWCKSTSRAVSSSTTSWRTSA